MSGTTILTLDLLRSIGIMTVATGGVTEMAIAVMKSGPPHVKCVQSARPLLMVGIMGVCPVVRKPSLMAGEELLIQGVCRCCCVYLHMYVHLPSLLQNPFSWMRNLRLSNEIRDILIRERVDQQQFCQLTENDLRELRCVINQSKSSSSDYWQEKL